MNHKILSGLTTAALLMTTLGLAPSSFANQSRSTDANSEVKVAATVSSSEPALTSTDSVSANVIQPTEETSQSPIDSSRSSSGFSGVGQAALTQSGQAIVSQIAPTLSIAPAESPRAATPSPEAAVAPIPGTVPSSIQTAAQPEAVKVGEYQSQETSTAEASIAVIQPHDLDGRAAATLYVRSIPVLTFLDDAASVSQQQEPQNSPGTKVASVQTDSASSANAEVGTEQLAIRPTEAPSPVKPDSNSQQSNDPVWRATSIAARLNQLHRDNVDAQTIVAAWDEAQQEYVIKVGEEELTAISEETILPDTTQNEAQDALQATNRLRRQMGNAPPLEEIEGAPESTHQISLGPVQFQFSGMASWYGPGFNGNTSASGEIFNQNDLTAAHPDLPFGTQVRVTNLDTGLSVVVRINDRGPYHGGRVIDLSAAAAEVIGLFQSGVAPVSIDVLGAVAQ